MILDVDRRKEGWDYFNVFFVLGFVLIIFITLLYKKKLIISVLLVLLFMAIHLLLNSPSFKSSYKYAYELGFLLSVLFMHTFQMLFYPLMVKFASLGVSKSVSVYVEYVTKGFVYFGSIGSIFILYMIFVKGLIIYN